MSNSEHRALLAELFVTDIEEIVPERLLFTFKEWDSLTALSFLIMVNDTLGKQISGNTIRGFQTIQDLLDVMEE